MKNMRMIVGILLILSGVAWLMATHFKEERGKLILTEERAEKAKPEFPGEAAAYWTDRLKTKGDLNPAFLNWRIKKDLLHKKQMKSKSGEPSFLPPMAFENYGPGNFGGRVRSLVVHPEYPDRILTAGVSGGVWKTVDGGETWHAQSDFLSNIAISCMVIDPDRPDTVYMGTGEGFFGWGMARGMGIFVSHDFGSSWEFMESTANVNFYHVNRLARIPNTQILMAATRSGLFRSVDLGQTWLEVSGMMANKRGFVDLKVDPTNPDILLASHFGESSGGITEMTTLNIDAPAHLAGTLLNASASFGPRLSEVGPLSGQLVLYDDPASEDSLGCESADNSSQLSGNIALIDRGSCQFTVKVKNAQNAGAAAVLIVNHSSGPPTTMGGADASINIPALMISKEDGDRIKPHLESGVFVTLDGESRIGGGQFICRSADKGATFEILGSAHGLPTSNLSRMEIGWGHDGVVYVAVSDDEFETLGLWRSADRGLNFTKTASRAKFIERQGWYDLVVGVDPSDSNRVYLGAVDLFRSVDAGERIQQVSIWNPSGGQTPKYVHADLHAIAFHPEDPSTFWVGCDGGVYKSRDSGTTFSSLNNDLRIAQNYGLAVHPSEHRVITGTQDNGSHMFYGEKAIWLEWYGGDGGFCAWDQQDPDYIYGSTPNGGLYGSSNMGGNSQKMELPDTTGALFIQPFALDPSNGDRLMVGTDNVFFTDNARQLKNATWRDVSGDIESIYAMAFNPVDGEHVFVASKSGVIYQSSQVSTSTAFQSVTTMPGRPTSIFFDPTDELGNTCYVTLAYYNTNRIWKTTDRGVSWQSIHGNLPEIPVHSIVNDPLFPERLFAGTELGLFVGHPVDGSYSWEQYDYGTAWTRVTNLIWGDDQTLWVSTYGRGTYRVSRNPLQIELTTSQILGDGDKYLDTGEKHLLSVALKNTTPLELDSLSVDFEMPSKALNLYGPSRHFHLGGYEEKVVSFVVEQTTALSAPVDETLHGTVIVGSVSFPISITLTMCANPNMKTGTYHYEAETLSPMVSTAELGKTGWDISSSLFHGGQSSVYAEEDSFYSLKTLTTPEFELTEEGLLSFWLAYNLEGDYTQKWDGLVLEYRVDGGAWEDLGSQNRGIPYDGTLMINNPLYLRESWSGTQREWREALVGLNHPVGTKVQFRFRLGCDGAAKYIDGGVWLDDLTVSGVTWEEAPLPDSDICQDCYIQPSQKPSQVFLPYVVGSDGRDTLVSAVNAWESSPVEMELVAFNREGIALIQTSTEIPPQAVFKISINEWAPELSSHIAWIQVGSSHKLEVCAENRDAATWSAYRASDQLSDQLVVPHVAKQTQLFETHLLMVNAGEDHSSLLLNSNIGSEFTLHPNVPPYQQVHKRAEEVLGSEISTTDWATLNMSNPSLSAMEFFTDPGQNSRKASLGLNTESGKRLRFLHIASDTQLFWTGLVYFNTSDQSTSPEEIYYDSGGNLLETKNVTLQPFEKRIILFDHNTDNMVFPADSSWMEVNADRNLIGYELFGASTLSENSFFAGLQGSYSQGKRLAFQVFNANEEVWTGLVLINAGQVAAAMSLSAYNAQGTLLETVTTDVLAPKSKSVFLGNNLFSSETRANTVWIMAHAEDSSWDGFSIWGDHGTSVRNYLAGIRAAGE
ncbi:MAG: hypothetical protein CSB47_03170 [Proteobacteria bacterium]|nr:MAG: hypothetical protein CSB47_03170 [Pseudomonadota bacterium]